MTVPPKPPVTPASETREIPPDIPVQGNTIAKLIAFLILICAPHFALAEEFIVSANAAVVPVAKLKEEGFDWMILPYRQPFDTKNPRLLPFDPNHNQRGILTPAQTRVISSALAPLQPLNRVLSAGEWFALPRAEGTGNPPLSLACEPLPGHKIRLISHGGGSAIEEGALENGQTMIFSTAGNSANEVNVYLVTVRKD